MESAFINVLTEPSISTEYALLAQITVLDVMKANAKYVNLDYTYKMEDAYKNAMMLIPYSKESVLIVTLQIVKLAHLKYVKNVLVDTGYS